MQFYFSISYYNNGSKPLIKNLTNTFGFLPLNFFSWPSTKTILQWANFLGLEMRSLYACCRQSFTSLLAKTVLSRTWPGRSRIKGSQPPISRHVRKTRAHTSYSIAFRIKKSRKKIKTQFFC